MSAAGSRGKFKVAKGLFVVPLNVVERHAVRANEIGSALPAIVFAEARDEPALVAEAIDAIGEIGGRATEGFPAGEDVPEEFSEGDDGIRHSMKINDSVLWRLRKIDFVLLVELAKKGK